jgi:hypothetical protein
LQSDRQILRAEFSSTEFHVPIAKQPPDSRDSTHDTIAVVMRSVKFAEKGRAFPAKKTDFWAKKWRFRPEMARFMPFQKKK